MSATRKNVEDSEQNGWGEIKATLKYQGDDIRSMRDDIKSLRDDVIKAAERQEERLLAQIKIVDLRTRNYPLVEKIVFGLVSLILVAVVTALIALVVTHGATGAK